MPAKVHLPIKAFHFIIIWFALHLSEKKKMVINMGFRVTLTSNYREVGMFFFLFMKALKSIPL